MPFCAAMSLDISPFTKRDGLENFDGKIWPNSIAVALVNALSHQAASQRVASQAGLEFQHPLEKLSG